LGFPTLAPPITPNPFNLGTIDVGGGWAGKPRPYE